MTINQITSVLRQIAESHPVLQSFVQGEEYSTLPHSVKYPLLFSNLENSTLNTDTGIVNRKYTVAVLTRRISDKEKDIDNALSDTERMLFDVITSLQRVDGLFIDGTPVLTPTYNANTDNTCGWSCDLNIYSAKTDC